MIFANTIKNAKGQTLYLRSDGMGYESSKVRRERRLGPPHCHVHHVCEATYGDPHTQPSETWKLPCTCTTGLTEEQAR